LHVEAPDTLIRQAEVSMNKDEPRNQEGQKPTRKPDETAQRLEEKAQHQSGDANRARTEKKAREAEAKR